MVRIYDVEAAIMYRFLYPVLQKPPERNPDAAVLMKYFSYATAQYCVHPFRKASITA